jgi:hypothetical protein
VAKAEAEARTSVPAVGAPVVPLPDAIGPPAMSYPPLSEQQAPPADPQYAPPPPGSHRAT